MQPDVVVERVSAAQDERLTEMDFERRKLLEELHRLRSSVGVVQNAYERRRK